MEIHIVQAGNAHLYEALLDENFRLRASIFVDELKWSSLRSVNGRERDLFDRGEATYYFAIHEGRLVGSIRRHCSLAPTLLSDVFAHLAERRFERAADVYESTRQYVIPEYREEHPCKVAGYLQRALWGHSLLEGGRAVNFVTWAWYVPLLTKSGLRPKPLGLPMPHEDMQLIALTCPVDEQVLDGLTAFYDLGPARFVTTGLEAAPSRTRRAA
jgi:acyl-homoserine lactone synthase